MLYFPCTYIYSTITEAFLLHVLLPFLQAAYDKSKEKVIQLAMSQLQKLFTVSGPSREMDLTSRAYGNLLFVMKEQNTDIYADEIKQQVPSSKWLIMMYSQNN